MYVTQNQKTKARFSHLLQHPVWKQSGAILVEWKGMEKQENRLSEYERENK